MTYQEKLIKFMNYKKKLIMFIKLKNKIIEKETGIKYIDKIDIKDFEKWPEYTCRKVYKELVHAIQENAYGLKDNTCPWCFKYSNICSNCTYADRHGKCGNGSSLYDSYSMVAKLFSNYVYKNMLKKIKDQDELSSSGQ